MKAYLFDRTQTRQHTNTKCLQVCLIGWGKARKIFTLNPHSRLPFFCRVHTTYERFFSSKQTWSFRLRVGGFFKNLISFDHGWNYRINKLAKFLLFKKPQISSRAFSRIFFILFIDFVRPPARLHLFKLRVHPKAHGNGRVASSDQFRTADPSNAVFLYDN